jgi:hypothetical protein
MIARIAATIIVLLFATGAFCGIGPESAGPLNPFGLLFLFIAALIWDEWIIIIGNFSPSLFDGMVGGSGDHYRASDDHYRRDGQQHYHETEEHQRRGGRRP